MSVHAPSQPVTLFITTTKESEPRSSIEVLNKHAEKPYKKSFPFIAEIFNDFNKKIEAWKKQSQDIVTNWKPEKKEERDKEFEKEFATFIDYKNKVTEAIPQVDEMITKLQTAIQFAKSDEDATLTPKQWKRLEKTKINVSEIQKHVDEHLVKRPAYFQELLEQGSDEHPSLFHLQRELPQQITRAKVALEPWAMKVKEKTEKLIQPLRLAVKYYTSQTSYMDRLIEEWERRTN